MAATNLIHIVDEDIAIGDNVEVTPPASTKPYVHTDEEFPKGPSD